MARLNLTIPDPLYERLDRLRDRVNVSKICAVALEKELDMLEGNATLVASPKVNRLVERIRWQFEQKEVWRQRGYDDGEAWGTDIASLEEIRLMAEEWDDDTDFDDILDDIDEDEFPTLRPRNRIDDWLQKDLEAAPGTLSRSALQQAREQVDKAIYMQGWRQAVCDLWREAEPALRRFKPEE